MPATVAFLGLHPGRFHGGFDVRPGPSLLEQYVAELFWAHLVVELLLDVLDELPVGHTPSPRSWVFMFCGQGWLVERVRACGLGVDAVSDNPYFLYKKSSLQESFRYEVAYESEILCKQGQGK